MSILGEEQTRRQHAWSDNDLFGQKWTNQDMSENTYELELSASCQNLSKAINSTKKCMEGTRFCRRYITRPASADGLDLYTTLKLILSSDVVTVQL